VVEHGGFAAGEFHIRLDGENGRDEARRGTHSKDKFRQSHFRFRRMPSALADLEMVNVCACIASRARLTATRPGSVSRPRMAWSKGGGIALNAARLASIWVPKMAASSGLADLSNVSKPGPEIRVPSIRV